MSQLKYCVPSQCIEELYLLYVKELGYSLRVSNTLLVAITPLRELNIILLGVTATTHSYSFICTKTITNYICINISAM